jgi:hypothetical protein
LNDNNDTSPPEKVATSGAEIQRIPEVSLQESPRCWEVKVTGAELCLLNFLSTGKIVSGTWTAEEVADALENGGTQKEIDREREEYSRDMVALKDRLRAFLALTEEEAA